VASTSVTVSKADAMRIELDKLTSTPAKRNTNMEEEDLFVGQITLLKLKVECLVDSEVIYLALGTIMDLLGLSSQMRNHGYKFVDKKL
jgi:hypothetical protein